MKSTLTFILFSILAMGCTRPDAKMHQQIIGSWNDGSMIFAADGSFRARFTSDSPKWTQEQAGTWDVRDGFLIMTVTNSISQNEPVVVPVGHVARCQITFIDAHTLTYKSTNGRETFTQSR